MMKFFCLGPGASRTALSRAFSISRKLLRVGMPILEERDRRGRAVHRVDEGPSIGGDIVLPSELNVSPAAENTRRKQNRGRSWLQRGAVDVRGRGFQKHEGLPVCHGSGIYRAAKQNSK